MFWPKLCKQGSVKVSGKLPKTHSTPNPCFSLTCDLRAETWVRGGLGEKFPRNVNWSVNRTKSVQGAWRFLFLSHLFKSNGICEKIFIMNRFISKSYSATKNTIDQQHKERGSCSRVFSHDVTAAILVPQNNETAAMLVSQTSPLGVELFSYANAFFCYNKFAYMLATWVKTLC